MSIMSDGAAILGGLSFVGEQVKASVLEQHDRLAVSNLAALDRCHCVVHREFQNLDILSLSAIASAKRCFAAGDVFGNEEVEFLRDRARAHERFEYLAYAVYAIACLLLDLGLDPVLRTGRVEQTSGRLDQHAGVTVYERRKPKLAGKEHRFAGNGVW